MSSNLQIVWESMSDKKRERKLTGKQPIPSYPFSEQSRYSILTQAVVDNVKKSVDAYITPELGRLWDEANPELRKDVDWSLTLSALYGIVESSFLDQEQIYREVESIAIGVEEEDRENWAKFTRYMVGVPLDQTEEWILAMRYAWVTQGVTLIQSLEEDILKSVKVVINNGISSGKRVETIADELYGKKGVFEKGYSRAKLIARDQVAKYNGQLWRKRQVDAGIQLYIWRDSNDERVRKTHAENDNRVYSWETPPSNDTGHPTEDYQCRCTAEAVMLFDLTDAQISLIIESNEAILIPYYAREAS